ncbi:MAG: hypothetical protein MKZ95_15835, partial [Pirellulales bacterium]|nr:hypothetical protein [Pirellulales bacterium]
RYAHAARVRALGPSRANPRAPPWQRRRVGPETEGTARMGGGRGGAHRIYAPPSYAALRAALGIETDLVAN